MTTFKDLHIGARFEFVNVVDVGGDVSELGPWVKRTVRTYHKGTTPFGTDEQAREHQEWNGRHCEVGTITVEVISCK